MIKCNWPYTIFWSVFTVDRRDFSDTFHHTFHRLSRFTIPVVIYPNKSKNWKKIMKSFEPRIPYIQVSQIFMNCSSHDIHNKIHELLKWQHSWYDWIFMKPLIPYIQDSWIFMKPLIPYIQDSWIFMKPLIPYIQDSWIFMKPLIPYIQDSWIFMKPLIPYIQDSWIFMKPLIPYIQDSWIFMNCLSHDIHDKVREYLWTVQVTTSMIWFMRQA